MGMRLYEKAFGDNYQDGSYLVLQYFEVMVADPEKPFKHSDPKSSRNQDHL